MAQPDQPSARYRRSPVAGSTWTRIAWPVVGSTNRSSVGRKRARAPGLAAARARRVARALGRLGAVAERSMVTATSSTRAA